MGQRRQEGNVVQKSLSCNGEPLQSYGLEMESRKIQKQLLTIKYIIGMETMVVVNNKTQRRANVIYKRTKSMEMGVIKSLLIDTLKAKLRSGVAHFVYLKKDGSLREAWGTT